MDRDAIERAVQLAGVSLPPDTEVNIIGGDPILKSPVRLGEGAAVARALTGVGASEVWRTKTGRPQAIEVDARHAAATLHSARRLEFLGEQPDFLSAPPRALAMTDIFDAKDGRHVQLHGSFTDAPKVLEVLGLPEDATTEDLRRTVRDWDAFALETALIERRLCGAAIRTREEWAAHPQGQAIADRPTVTITKIGEAPPEPLPDGPRPLSGVRVLDLTRVLAGPTCARTMAEHGADVLHVIAPHLARTGLFEVDTGFGKRETFVDLNDAQQADDLRDLVRQGDVFSQGYRLGTLARRGFGPEELAKLRPGIVYVAENCYGPIGPWAERPGWEQLAQAATGMEAGEGLHAPDGRPRLAPAAVNDYSTGYFAAYGAMMALARRATEGGSWLVQVSLSQTSMWYQRLGTDCDPEAAELGDLSPFFTETDSAYGRLRHLKPALSLSETPPHWASGPRRLGSDDAAWMPR
jgi:crotonobetainyl-CoA:carnitine CoA-transferase CaiB-like acyl-CoA transferase